MANALANALADINAVADDEFDKIELIERIIAKFGEENSWEQTDICNQLARRIAHALAANEAHISTEGIVPEHGPLPVEVAACLFARLWAM